MTTNTAMVEVDIVVNRAALLDFFALVGWTLGENDGVNENEGVALGTRLGSTVGFVVGESVGDVGIAEGRWVVIGAEVGFIVGESVGDAEGTRLGCTVGIVGDKEGKIVGLTVTGEGSTNTKVPPTPPL